MSQFDQELKAHTIAQAQERQRQLSSQVPLDIVQTNRLFAPYLQELETACLSIAKAINEGVNFSECPIYRLRGKLSALQGILKGIELNIKAIN